MEVERMPIGPVLNSFGIVIDCYFLIVLVLFLIYFCGELWYYFFTEEDRPFWARFFYPITLNWDLGDAVIAVMFITAWPILLSVLFFYYTCKSISDCFVGIRNWNLARIKRNKWDGH